MARVTEESVETTQTARALRGFPILKMIVRAHKAGITREEIKRLLLMREEEANAIPEQSGGGWWWKQQSDCTRYLRNSEDKRTIWYTSASTFIQK